MASGPDINYPAQPTYGEGMADAMKAQMQMLTGTGDFADIYADAGLSGGNLGDILREVEAPIRQQTAQTDTDVLRQTLLGNQRQVQVTRDPETGKFGVPDSQLVMDENGEPQTAGGGRYQMVLLSDTKSMNTKEGALFAVFKDSFLDLSTACASTLKVDADFPSASKAAVKFLICFSNLCPSSVFCSFKVIRRSFFSSKSARISNCSCLALFCAIIL